jgi:hypothetical protein
VHDDLVTVLRVPANTFDAQFQHGQIVPGRDNDGKNGIGNMGTPVNLYGMGRKLHSEGQNTDFRAKYYFCPLLKQYHGSRKGDFTIDAGKKSEELS